MILKFDVTRFLLFVPKSHNSIDERELYVLDISLQDLDVFQLIRNNSEVEVYRVNQEGSIDFNNSIKMRLSEELKPAWSTVRYIDGKKVDVIFE